MVTLASSMILLALGAGYADRIGLSTEPVAINGGNVAMQCEWPSAVVMLADNPGIPQCGGSNKCLCSGTLVHPEIVITAGHCVDFPAVQFGEDAGMPKRVVQTDHCMSKTNWTIAFGPEDYAYCKLAEPVTDIPITPIAFGCEADGLAAGDEVVIAGFGMNAPNAGGAGTKRWGETVIEGQNMFGMWVVGESGSYVPLPGDSGGPAFKQMSDGTWRVFGIVSGGAGQGSPGHYVRADAAIPWIEQNSGVDLTPCHDPDGTWNPGPGCWNFVTEPLAGGTWSVGCTDGDPGSGPSSSCGEPFDPMDAEGPIVEITSPLSGQVFDDVPADVTVAVSATDAVTGVASVTLEVDGVAIGTDVTPPYEFVAQFPEGPYALQAKAVDRAGNESASAVIGIAVGDAEPPDPPPTSSGSAVTGPSSGSGDGTSVGGAEDGGRGSCNSSSGAVPTFALAGVWFLGWRRRRSA